MSTFTALIGLICRRRMWSWWTAFLKFQLATESHTSRLHRHWVFRLWKSHGVCVYVRRNIAKSNEVDCIEVSLIPCSRSKNVNRCGSYVPLGSLHHAKDVYDSSQVCSRPLQTVLSCLLSPSSSSSLLVPPSSPPSLLSLLQASLFQLETNNVIHGRAGHCAKPPPTSYHIYNASTHQRANTI